MSAIQDRAAALLAASEYRDLTPAELKEAEDLSRKALGGYRADDRLRKVAGPASSRSGSAPVTPAAGPSLAREFTSSESYQRFKAANPHLGETGAVTIPPAQVSSRALLGVGQKAITGGTSLVSPDFQVLPQAVTPPMPPPRLINLISVSPTESDLVPVRQAGQLHERCRAGA